MRNLRLKRSMSNPRPTPIYWSSARRRSARAPGWTSSFNRWAVLSVDGRCQYITRSISASLHSSERPWGPRLCGLNLPKHGDIAQDRAEPMCLVQGLACPPHAANIARAMQDPPLGDAPTMASNWAPISRSTNISELIPEQSDQNTLKSPCPRWQVSASLQGAHRMGCPCRLVMWHGHCPSTRCWRWCCAVWHVLCGSFRLHRGSLPMA